MHHFVTIFSGQKVPGLSGLLSKARDLYDQNLNLYIRQVLRRPLSRLLDFFNGLEALLRTTPPNEISLHSAYTKSSLKRTIASFDLKDLRKATEALSKRVDKHFNDVLNPSVENAEAIRTVWRSCEDEMVRLTKSWRGLISKCYESDKVQLEFGEEDVRGVFKKFKPMSAGGAS
jgi:exocyst complex component 1